MKVSLNWVKELIDFELPPVEELVEKIGAQLGAVEEVVDLGARYKGIVIVKVVSCQKMEGSDHLSVCRIDDGGITPDVNRESDGLVQVVCGAPNVREGVLVAWLPPGSTVPSTYDSDPFVLEARPLRGVVSNGMLASARELAMGDSHEGLLLLDDADLEPGMNFAEKYQLNDHIIDIENKMFTHRPDCFGMLGVAREIAGICGRPFTSPPVYLEQPPAPDATASHLEIRNEIPELVPRFVAQVFHNVAVKPSPVWLQSRLSRVGLRPVNNVVDITNYFMMLTGQPLHAYDYDKVKALDGGDKAVLVVRQPRDREKLTLLNGKTIDPRQEAILIASATTPIGLGGVMGGAATEVDENTKNIILECASFDMYSIRRTSMEHGLFSDAVTRFNKGQSPLQNARVVAWAREELMRSAAAEPGDYVDLNHLSAEAVSRDSLYPPVRVETEFVNARLGADLNAEAMAALLTNVECAVKVGDGQLQVTPPFWRTDIELREDVIEEVGRLYGFDKLPLELPARRLTPTAKNALFTLKQEVCEQLAAAGANELLTYSFVHGNLLEKVGQDKNQAFELSNALSPDLQYYRLSLTPSLLEKVHPNSKAGYDEFALFEFGRAHHRQAVTEGLPEEKEALSLVFAAEDKTARQKYAGAPYYEARKYLIWLLAAYDVAHGAVSFDPLAKIDIPNDPWTTQLAAPYEPARSALLRAADGKVWGIVGEFRPAVRRALKLPAFAAGFEIDPLLLISAPRASAYVALPKYPRVSQDISLRVPAELPYGTLFDFVWDELAKIQPVHTLPGLTPLDIYQRDDDPDHKQITLRFTIASYERTLTDAEVGRLLDQVALAAQQHLNAERL